MWTYTYGYKTITITVDAYDRLKMFKKSETESFSDLILRIIPEKRKLSEILVDYDPNPDLADHIKKISDDMRTGVMRKVDLS